MKSLKSPIIYIVLSSNHGSWTPSQGPPLGVICSVNTTQKRSRRGFDRITDAIYLKSRFLKDVSNKITSFAVSKRCRNRFEIVAKRVLGFKYSEEEGQDLREEKYLQKSHATKTLGTGPQALLWPYIRIQINHIQRVRIQMNHIQRVMQNISRSGDTCLRTTPHRARHGGGFTYACKLKKNIYIYICNMYTHKMHIFKR